MKNLMDPYYKDICPICGSDLKKALSAFTSKRYCENNCFVEEEAPFEKRCYMFDEQIAKFHDFDENGNFLETNPPLDLLYKQNIKEKVTYWKENDRYLMKIITT